MRTTLSENNSTSLGFGENVRRRRVYDDIDGAIPMLSNMFLNRRKG
jgi:hypothetical protein